ETGILTEIIVHDGQWVEPGTDLARFRSPQLELDRQQYEKQRDAAVDLVRLLENRKSATSDPAARSRLDSELRDARAAVQMNTGQLRVIQQRVAAAEVV